MINNLIFKSCMIASLILVENKFVAQSSIWVQNNATWHYDFDNFTGTFGFLKTEHIGDTVLSGNISKVFATKSYVFYTDMAQIVHLQSINDLDTNYTWNNANQVYYWHNNQFELLYDFTKSTGESYQIVSSEPNVFMCDSASSTTVLGTGIITLNGQNYPTMDLQSGPTNHSRLSGSINARFGNFSPFSSPQNWLFPQQMLCDPSIIVEYGSYVLRCFQDDSLEFNPLNQDCEYLLNNVGMPELSANGFMLYPNPAADFITLVCPVEQNNVAIYNLSGKMVYSTKTSAKLQEIKINLPSGTYFLKANTEQGLNYTEKFIVQ